MKHRRRKSSSNGEQPSGSGGLSSSTILNMTGSNLHQQQRKALGDTQPELTRHTVTQLRIRGAPSKELDDSAGQGPYIRLCRCTLQHDDLGGHPVRCPSHIPNLVLRHAKIQGDAKVGELDVGVLCGQNVRSLEVAMDDVIGVEIMKPFKDFNYVARNEMLIEFPK